MSLIVSAYTGTRDSFEWVAHSSSELFGFEVCRAELWGHPVMHRLGLTLLPTLKDADIYAEGEALLAQLEREARTILLQLAQIAAATKYDEEFVTFRTRNLLHAVSRARELGGGVYIG